MKNYLLSILFIFALAFSAIGQTTLVDFETVTDPLVEPFDLTSYTSDVANPYTTGNTSSSVGEVVKKGSAFWGGINVYFGGDVTFTGTNDKFTVDFYTADAGINDSILFKFQLFNRYGGSTTIEVDAFYTKASDTQVGVWKTLEFALPDGTTGSYNQMVIFFGWTWAHDGDTYYFDNIVAPGYNAYGNTDVTFNITDKFNNATDVGLFIDGTAATLTQTSNVYSNTTSLASYNITVGQSAGIYEIVYTHKANGVEVRDTTSLICGNTAGAQEMIQLIIVETPEDGTAKAISVGTTPPVIDGTIDDVWNNARTHTLQERSWWGNPTGLYSQWKVMWDVTNIYLLFIVEDATPYNGNANNYENDCIEIFFDMNKSATTPYDANDWQIRTIRGLDTWTGSANVTPAWAANASRDQSSMASDAGYIVEIAIPWSSLSTSFLPVATVDFNFDACVADVGASGGARLFRESWTTAADVAYLNTEFFGTITLSAETNEVTSISKISQIPNLSVYPNPVIDRLNISSSSTISKVEIFDIIGRKTSEISNINNSEVNLNVTNLGKSAIYIVKITDIHGNTSARKITIK